MKILAMSAPGSGMFLPTIPIAWALRAAGHDVLLANNGAAAKTVSEAGLPVVDVCPDRDVFGEFMKASYAINTTPPGQPRPRRGGLGLFGAEMAEGLLSLAEIFHPDLILSTLEQGAGPLIAAALGVPHIEQSVRLAWAGPDEQARHYRKTIADYLEPTRTRLGLPRPPLEPTTTIDIRPPSLGGRETPSQWLMRYVPYNESRLIPDWALAKPPRPRVALTMGSVLPCSGGLSALTKLLATLADVEVEIVLALGNVELSSIGELPDNVRPVGWMPLSALLPNCAVIVHHAGAGTSMTALASGVPHVVIPHNADQPANAAILADRGVGIRLDPANVTPEAVRDGLERLLTEPGFRDAALEVHDEIAGQPAPTDIVTRIELLMS
ncbi:MAG: nucleotide disphospho-sugar-binding domain-containing protein [Pseudonocardiaceae bacterium]